MGAICPKNKSSKGRRDQRRANWNQGREFAATMEKTERDKLLKGWHKAVKCALYWASEDTDG